MSRSKFRGQYDDPIPVKTETKNWLDMTDQSFAEEADLNKMLEKYHRTGQLPGNVRVGTYGDFYEAPDFMAAQQTIIEAESHFLALPSRIRARFGNDPVNFLAFVHDKNNLEEARKLGLLKDEPPAPTTTTDTKTPETK